MTDNAIRCDACPVLCRIRLGKTVDTLGHDREWSADRFLKPPQEMARLFGKFPEAIENQKEILARVNFSLDEISY